MKRVGGKVTWLIEFERLFAGLAEAWVKRQTLQRCHIVAPGDTLRLAEAGREPWAEVTVTRVRTLRISTSTVGGMTAFEARIGGVFVDGEELEAVAVADGFMDGREMIVWLGRAGKMPGGVFDGVIIEW